MSASLVASTSRASSSTVDAVKASIGKTATAATRTRQYACRAAARARPVALEQPSPPQSPTPVQPSFAPSSSSSPYHSRTALRIPNNLLRWSSARTYATTTTMPPPTTASASQNSSSSPSPSAPFKGKGKPPSSRELPIRKQYLLDQYEHIFTNSEVIIFLQPSQFTVAELTKLRVDLSVIPPPPAPLASSSSSSSSSNPSAEAINDAAASLTSGPRFIFLRAGLMRPAANKLSHLPLQPVLEHLERNGGSLAALTLPTLHPPTLKAALAAVQTLSNSPNVRKLQAEAAAAAAAGGGGAGAAGKGGRPGAPPKAGAGAGVKEGGKKEERLPVIAALIESKTVAKEELTRIASLPAMDQILAQLVALMETPARGVISMTARAGGEDLARTLEGFKLGLEEAAAGASAAAAVGEGQKQDGPERS